MPQENQDRDAIASQAIGIASEQDPGDREPQLSRIGPYQIVKQIGESASSIVFQAEQLEPVRLTAALKLIKHGPDWRQVVTRFEAVQQVLTRMDHPNIAKVFGAGTRQSGQPYLVLELVDGLPLTKYCDERKQSLQQRLELFVSVCQAMQYAHQKGIIHGDLKPSNVLVSSREGKPQAKILDLGVAQAVRRKPSENAPSTRSGGLGDKPEYLSPEQADPNDPDIDTSSDVYNLGVILYELVTGTTPLTSEHLKDVSMTETLRLIREEVASPPSERLNESKDRLSSVAAKRQMKPDALLKAVAGDLDCVVMKALQKDRSRRYATVNELVRDLERYLAKEPVEACPHDARSPLRTVARQHPRTAMIAAGMLLVLFLVALGAAGLAAWEWREEKQARKAEQEAVEKREKAEKEAEKIKGKLKRAVDEVKERTRERDEAQAGEKKSRRSEEELKSVLAFLKHKLLSTGRPGDISLAEAFWAGSQGKDVTVRKNMTMRNAVDEAESHVGVTFADRPQAEASVREMLGLAYLNLGDATKAVKQYERALALWEAMRGANNPETAECLNRLAVAYRLAGRDADAARLYHRNLNSSAHASTLAVRGAMLLSQKKPAEAELMLRQSLTIREKNQPDDWTTFDTKSMLGAALQEQKKYDEAEPLLLAGYEGLKKRKPDIPTPDEGRLTRAIERLVQLYEAWGKKDEAAKWRKELESMKTSTPRG